MKGFVWWFIATLSLIQCQSFHKTLSNASHQELLELAKKTYEQENYFRTQQIIETILPVYRGTQQAEWLMFLYAYTFYKQQDYLTAAFHFQNLARTFPNSKYAEEALFMAAKCKFQYSPPYYLDQKYTREAIDNLQLFINKYPGSQYVTEVNEMIDILRGKLERKSFENAKLFFRIQDYQAAIVSLQNHIRDFPGTTFAEEALFLIIKSYYLFAQQSVQEKQVERYAKVLDYWLLFSSEFPQSKFLQEANFYQSMAKKSIEKMNTSR